MRTMWIWLVNDLVNFVKYDLAQDLRFILRKYKRMMKPFSILLLALMLTTAASSQSLAAREDTLITVTDSLMLSTNLEVRQRAFDELTALIVQALESDTTSWNYPFDKLQRTSVVYAPDSSFRIFSGQFFIDEDHYKYYGLIQRRDPSLPLIELIDSGWSRRGLAREHLDSDSWPGAVYYQLTQFEKDGKRYYLACGFNAFRMFENRKVAEVIHFENDQLILGADMFARDSDQDLQSRLILRYGADVGIRLTFDEQLDMLIFDNLIPMKSPYEGTKMVMVPDGSYSGYQQDEQGRWNFVEKVFHQTVSSPPLEMEVLKGDREKDIFGKKPRKR